MTEITHPVRGKTELGYYILSNNGNILISDVISSQKEVSLNISMLLSSVLLNDLKQIIVTHPTVNPS